VPPPHPAELLLFPDLKGFYKIYKNLGETGEILGLIWDSEVGEPLNIKDKVILG
jgi:hypothetical protein